MKVALIPPIPEFHHFETAAARKNLGLGSFHLLLSHLVTRPAYKRHYQKERMRGAYLILDNSAHEFHAGETAEVLLHQAVELNVQELVVPDVLEDSEGTIEGAISALEVWFESKDRSLAHLNPALMYVPQGRDVKDWAICLRDLVSLHRYMSKRYNLRRDFVLGLSKDYETWDGGLRRLLLEFLEPLRDGLAHEGTHLQVHLLGWGRCLWELGALSREFPWVRSTDSAKPFVYALGGIQLDPGQPAPLYPTRPHTYFSKKYTDHQRAIAVHNCKVFRGLARGEIETVHTRSA